METIEEQLRENDNEQQNLQSPLTSLEEELRDCEQDIVELQRDLSEAKEKLSKCESLLTTREWLISRDEIEITSGKVQERGATERFLKADMAVLRLR